MSYKENLLKNRQVLLFKSKTKNKIYDYIIIYIVVKKKIVCYNNQVKLGEYVVMKGED